MSRKPVATSALTTSKPTDEKLKTEEPIDYGFKALFVMDNHRIPVEIKSKQAFDKGKEAFHLKNSNAKIRFVRVMQFAEQHGANLSNVPDPITRFMKSTELKLDELYLRNPTDEEKQKGLTSKKFKVGITLDFAAGVLTQTAAVDAGTGVWTVSLKLIDQLKQLTAVGGPKMEKTLGEYAIKNLEAETDDKKKLTGNVLLELDPALVSAEKDEIALNPSDSEKTSLIATKITVADKWSAPVRMVTEGDGLCFREGDTNIPPEFKSGVTYFATAVTATIDPQGIGTLTFKLATKPEGVPPIVPAKALEGVTLKPAAAGLLTSLTGFDMTGLLDIQEITVVVSRGVDKEPEKPEGTGSSDDAEGGKGADEPNKDATPPA